MIDHDLVTTDDGRQIAFEVSGAVDGYPVFLMHGTPGSKTGPKPRSLVLETMGVKLICHDRPGYGDSSRWKDRLVRDVATDVEILAKKLNITECAVVGRSGGGPHALACAALLPHLVTRSAVLVSIAPVSAPDLDWFAGMNEANIAEYNAADVDYEELVARLTLRAELAMIDPDSMVQFLEPQMSDSDRHIVEDISFRRLLHANYQEALRPGPHGWIDDALAFRQPWGFPLHAIRTEVKLWHGLSDTFSPVEHTRWLRRQLVNAKVSIQIQPNAAHFDAMPVLPEILTWLIEPAVRDEPPAGARDFSPRAPVPPIRTGAAR